MGLLSFACMLWPAIVAADDSLPWHPLVEGLSVTSWTPQSRCQEDISTVIVRVDPELFHFSVYHFQDEGLSAPLPLTEWQRHTNAVLLFNAGLFLQDFSYMGLLFKDGRPLSQRPHAQWQGVFVAEPVERGMRRARILDLSIDTFPDEPLSYREAAQALMVLDRGGHLRVRNSGKRAQQTLVAEDAKGYVYVVKTVTASSLYGLGSCLHRRLPWLRQIMAMDGGSSSDLLIGASTLLEAGKNAVGLPWRSIVDGTAPATHIPLPAVIGIAPRSTDPGRSTGSPGERSGP